MKDVRVLYGNSHDDDKSSIYTYLSYQKLLKLNFKKSLAINNRESYKHTNFPQLYWKCYHFNVHTNTHTFIMYIKTFSDSVQSKLSHI